MEPADAIWNRACDPTATLERAGDRALQAVLLVHGQVMNSGLYSAMYINTHAELVFAADGFEYFGSTTVAGVLRDALREVFADGPIDDRDTREDHVDEFDERSPEVLDRLEARYHEQIRDDGALEARFRHRLRTSPNDFAALE